MSLGKSASVMFASALENVKWEPNKGGTLMWCMPHAILYWRSKRALCKNSAAQCGPVWVWNKFLWAGSQVLHRIFVLFLFYFYFGLFLTYTKEDRVVWWNSVDPPRPNNHHFMASPPHPYPGALWKLVKPLSVGFVADGKNPSVSSIWNQPHSAQSSLAMEASILTASGKKNLLSMSQSELVTEFGVRTHPCAFLNQSTLIWSVNRRYLSE